jgi:Arylsulfotransferase (ASST)
VLFEAFGLIKLDRDSKTLWTYSDRVHHDMDVDVQGGILALAWREQTLTDSRPPRRVLGDNIIFVSPEGRRTRGISVLSALEGSPWAALVRFSRNQGADLLHTNTVSLLDGRHARDRPAFRKGNLLVALRNLDFIGVIDPERGSFVWGLAGMWHQPHEPVLLPNGRLLVFDNYGRRRGDAHRSLVLELDPVTQQVAWSFGGEPEFFSKVVGLAQRLPNGNTLVTSSTEGRVLEVTANGELVWEFRNPYQVVEGEETKAATLFEVVRIDPARVSWLRPDGVAATSARPD